ncbi:MAG: hypothetical protein DMG94_13560 [Acidobacteria bacterium]|nr:MAG: hypothetical protein DMG94_13560 [Acidobacteriota bacterium]
MVELGYGGDRLCPSALDTRKRTHTKQRDIGLPPKHAINDVIAAEGKEEGKLGQSEQKYSMRGARRIAEGSFCSVLHSTKSLPEDRQLLLFLRF